MTHLCIFISLFTTVGTGSEAAIASINSTAGNVSATTTMKLTLVSPWKDITTKLLVPGTAGPPTRKCQILEVPAKAAIFAVRAKPNDPSAMKIGIMAVADPNTKQTCVIEWQAGSPITFYVSDKSGMKSYSVIFALVWSDSFFQIPTANGSVQAAIARFESEFDDQKLYNIMLQRDGDEDHRISLIQASSKFYFSDVPTPGGASVIPTIESFDVTDSVLSLSIRNPSTKVPATYWIDLQSRKIIKSEVNGQQMDLSTAKRYAVPLSKS